MAPVSKIRLDKLLVERGLCETRAQAQGLIMDGKVRVNGEVITKAGTLLDIEHTTLELSQSQPYVSRGGFKLEKALAVFDLSVTDQDCIDVGASTGGFTDVLLRHGARSVAAVDVGYGQLDWKLRNDPRVHPLEKTNIRALAPGQLRAVPTVGVVDTSFISLRKVLPALSNLLAPQADMVALLKPQFEYKAYVTQPGFHGVIHGEERHQRIVTGVVEDLAQDLPEWALLGLDFSPITGPKGNLEFLLHYRRMPVPAPPRTDGLAPTAIADLITKSYAQLAPKRQPD